MLSQNLPMEFWKGLWSDTQGIAIVWEGVVLHGRQRFF